MWPGVGQALAAQFAEAGITSPAAVTAQRLRTLPRVTDRRADRLYTSWISAGQTYAVAELLVPLDLPVRWAGRLIEALGDDAAGVLRTDPWRLLALPDATVNQADQLARSVQPEVSREDARRGKALVDWTLARFARDGHTAAPADLVAQALRPFGVEAASAVAAAADAGAVDRVTDPARAGEPDAQDTWLARSVLAAAEDDIALGLLRLQRTATSLAGARAVKRVVGELDAVQAGAVTQVAGAGVSLLTGGPGTGKSRTVSAVVALAQAVSATVALAAPTGRAAKRLEELTGAPATTVHRLLGARRAAGAASAMFEHTADDPVEADLVVVDEASMLDVELAAALIDALSDGTHLLLVGDPAQLPSIGPGRVLGDLLDSGVFPVTELRTLYRQSEGGAIARLATAVRDGELPVIDDPDREVVLVPARGSAEAAHRVAQLVTDSIPRVFGVSGDQVQVVTPVHRGPAGTQALNVALKARLNPPAEAGHAVRGFQKGDRVVATANHPEAEPVGYANGEVGTVVSTGDGVRVAFTGGEAEISGKALNDLLHGWAITVHRAQGSEWEAVVAVVPPEAGSMLSRPLFYTALTRARIHLSVVHAAGPALARAVHEIGTVPRRTRLAALVRHPPVDTGDAVDADGYGDADSDPDEPFDEMEEPPEE
nr:AAA family ATPase [Nakamurella flavida]